MKEIIRPGAGCEGFSPSASAERSVKLEHSGRVNMFESGGFTQTRSTRPDQKRTSSFVNIRRWGTYKAS